MPLIPPPLVMGPGIYVQEVDGPGVIQGVDTSITAVLGRTTSGPVGAPTPIASFAEFVAQFGGLRADSATTYAVEDFFVNGGSRAVIVRLFEGDPEADDESAPLTPAAYAAGLAALEHAGTIGLLCVPPDDEVDGQTDPRVYTAAAGWCERNRSFLLVDAPNAWEADVASITPARFADDLGIDAGSTRARFAATYFPRALRPDPLRGGAPRRAPVCGMMAGICARTDAARGVWRAPAGVEAALAGVTGLSRSLSDAENGRLNGAGVNAVRSFPGVGTVSWGARTLRGSDAVGDHFQYLNVRRLANYIEHSVLGGTAWAAFEPNDEALWARLRLSVEAFMMDLFRDGAFAGSTPRDAFVVKCDAGTTTETDRAAGVVNLIVGFAPTRPAEFVVVVVQQRTVSAP